MVGKPEVIARIESAEITSGLPVIRQESGLERGFERYSR
jgi:hypothetical protein